MQVFLAGDNSGVFRSTNNGEGWIPVNSGLKNRFVQCLASNGKNIFAGTYGWSNTLHNGGVFVSTNYGESWTEANSGLAERDIRSLAVTSNESVGIDLYAGSWDEAGSGHGVFRSTNNGKDWTSLNLALPWVTWINCFAFIPKGTGGTNIFTGTFGTYGPGAGIYLSADNGESWSPVNTGIPHTIIYSLAVISQAVSTFTECRQEALYQ